MSQSPTQSLIELTPDTDLEARLHALAKSAGESADVQRKLAEETPANQPSTKGDHLIAANRAQEIENEYRMLAHAVGAGRRILVSTATYEAIFP